MVLTPKFFGKIVKYLGRLSTLAPLGSFSVLVLGRQYEVNDILEERACLHYFTPNGTTTYSTDSSGLYDQNCFRNTCLFLVRYRSLQREGLLVRDEESTTFTKNHVHVEQIT